MNTQSFDEINAMIQQDLATSRQLLALLEEETTSTQTRNYETLTRLLKDKTPLLDQLQKNAQIRSEWLASLGKQADEHSWGEVLQHINNQNLNTQWQEVKTNIEQCQRINTLNGQLINRGITSHTRLLQIMRGNIHQADLYDAKGSKHAAIRSYNLTQA